MAESMFWVTDDGVEGAATVSGTGRPLILLPGGIDYTGRGWDRVVTRLTPSHRVVRFVRRFYRPELGDPFRWSLADDARDVAAIAAHLGGSVDLLGHSSGGVLALECLVRDPALYGSAVVFEAPITLGSPLDGAALARARTELEQGHLVRAISTFFRDVVGLPAWSARLAAAGLAVSPTHRRWFPRQLADLAAIDALGDRRSAYAGIVHPVLGIWGTTSPPHLAERMMALADVVPGMTTWTTGGGHAAARQHPQPVADQIAAFFDGSN